jgi:hypothetical protein
MTYLVGQQTGYSAKTKAPSSELLLLYPRQYDLAAANSGNGAAANRACLLLFLPSPRFSADDERISGLLIYSRDEALANSVAKLFDRHESGIASFGALHLSAKNGVVARPMKMGFKVHQL